MTDDFVSSEDEAAFDGLVKRALAKEWERFTAPSAQVWQALADQIGSHAQAGWGAQDVAAITDGTEGLSNLHCVPNEVGPVLGSSGPQGA